MITVPSLRQFPYGELALSGTIYGTLTHHHLRFGCQTPCDQP